MLDIYYYGARWYDPVVGRFLQADTIVPNPGNPQSWNRYAYALNNPLLYNDPTGHAADAGGASCDDCYEEMYEAYETVAQSVDSTAYYGTLQEYLAGKAVVYYNLWTQGSTSPNTQLSESMLEVYQTRLAINGRYGTSVAVQEAYLAAGGESTVALTLAAGASQLGSNTLLGRRANVPNPYGINGNPAHQRTVRRLLQMARRDFKGKDVVVERNSSIKDMLGGQIDRRPDVVVRDLATRRVLKVYEAARVNKNGTFVSRERAKMADYNRFGVPSHFEGVP